MSCRIKTIPAFDKAIKRLRKRYPHIKRDLQSLLNILHSDPFAGTAIPGFSHKVWKIRMGSIDMQAGKRGGFRVMYLVEKEHESYTCYLLYVYPKPRRKDMSRREIEQLLQEMETHLLNVD